MSAIHISIYVLFLLDITSASRYSYRPFECVADVPDPELSSQPNAFVSFINLNEDTTLEVQIFNADKLDSSKYPPLLFIHGYAGSRWSWLSTIQCMDYYKKHALILVSIKGFGDSQIYNRVPRPAPQNPFSIPALSEEMIQLLDILEVNQAIWIGFSFGSFITYFSAATYPERVKSMLLIGSGLRVFEPVCEFYIPIINDLDCTDRDVVDGFFPKEVLEDEISADYANQAVREGYKPEIKTYQTVLNLFCPFDGSVYLGDLTLKTTLIWGELDEILPFDQDFVDAFTSTTPKVFFVEDARHWAHWWDPREVSQRILEHIKWCSPSSPSSSSSSSSSSESSSSSKTSSE